MKILIIEDNKKLADNIKTFLELENFVVETAYDGVEGQDMLLNNKYDCIVLDLSLPKIDGVEICQNARKDGVISPIIMLTARTGKKDVISGLNVGADDYITKPFEMSELVARVRAAIRRHRQQPNPQITVGSIKIDVNKKKVTKEGKSIKLAPREYSLLEYLALNKNKVQERVKIIEHVWGDYDELMFSQTIDVHISYLRKKLGKKVIKTAPGGYYIEAE